MWNIFAYSVKISSNKIFLIFSDGQGFLKYKIDVFGEFAYACLS